jgi:hypothetical protein
MTLSRKHACASKKNRAKAHASDRAQQPAQVVAGRTQHCMQRVAGLPLEPTALHAMVLLHMVQDRLDHLPSLEPAPLRGGQGLMFSTMNQVY